jgi:hypothetical protein
MRSHVWIGPGRGCASSGLLAEETTAEGLEGLGLAAWWLDDAAVMFEARDHAYRLYCGHGDRRSAGRLATLLGIDYYQFRGDAAIGNGWFRRAHRLLEGLEPVSEHGWLSVWEGQITLVIGNDSSGRRRAWRGPARGAA